MESAWTKADSVIAFIQAEPREGEPGTERTVAYLLYDDQHLYVAFKCSAMSSRWEAAGMKGRLRLSM